MPAHRKKQTRRTALYTAVFIAVVVFVAIIGFGGRPKHSSPAADAQTPSVRTTPSAVATTGGTPSPSATPSPTASPSAAKPKPSATSTGLGTTDGSLKSLAQQVASQPVRIQIPALHVDASVIPVGVTAAGALEVPENVVQAAWYQAGNAPGQSGTSIIAAHVDFNGKLGLFNQLHSLKKGDVILVTDYSRHVHRFTAVAGRLFPKSDPSTVQALAAASATPGKSQLALITCGGGLDTQKHSYYDNFVLLANG